MEKDAETGLLDSMLMGHTGKRNLRILFVKCNCCGNDLYLEVTRHGYVSFSCSGDDTNKERGCAYSREMECYCPKKIREVVCLNKTSKSLEMSEKMRSMLLYFIYTFTNTRPYCTMITNHRKYKIFQQAVVQIANACKDDFSIVMPRIIAFILYHKGKPYETRYHFFRGGYMLYFIWYFIKKINILLSSFSLTKKIAAKSKKKIKFY